MARFVAAGASRKGSSTAIAFANAGRRIALKASQFPLVTSAIEERIEKAPCYSISSNGASIHKVCKWWRFTDSNRGPVDYDSIALTD